MPPMKPKPQAPPPVNPPVQQPPVNNAWEEDRRESLDQPMPERRGPSVVYEQQKSVQQLQQQINFDFIGKGRPAKKKPVPAPVAASNNEEDDELAKYLAAKKTEESKESRQAQPQAAAGGGEEVEDELEAFLRQQKAASPAPTMQS